MSTADKSAEVSNERRALRKSVRTLGEIVDGSGQVLLECTVLDLSMSGARLNVASATPRKAFTPAVTIPDLFRLQIPRDNIVVDCQRAWAEGDLIGVAFTSAFRPLKAARASR